MSCRKCPKSTAQARPETVSELTNAQREAAALKLQVPEVKAKLERCDKKNRTLRSIGGGVDTTLVEARMEEFEIMRRLRGCRR